MSRLYYYGKMNLQTDTRMKLYKKETPGRYYGKKEECRCH